MLSVMYQIETYVPNVNLVIANIVGRSIWQFWALPNLNTSITLGNAY